MSSAKKLSEQIRVLIVDDSALYRKAISSVLSESNEIEVVGIAHNGEIALDRIEQLSPDLVTLDLQMPGIDGYGVLREIKRRGLCVSSIVLSAFSKEGARSTTKALEAGAFDFVLKPDCSDPTESKDQLRQELVPKVLALKELRDKRVKRQASSSTSVVEEGKLQSNPTSLRGKKPSIVAIGISTGGPAALAKVIPQLPNNFPVPIVIVQHMPPVFTASLAEELNRSSALNVVEGSDGLQLAPGMVVIAPGGKQMKLEKTLTETRVIVNDDPPERNCRPSVDYLFRSLADSYGQDCLTIVMTGMGNDGLLGCRLLKRRGAFIMAQDEDSSVVYGMPKQIVENNLADLVCSLDRLPYEINNIVNKGSLVCN